MLIFVDFLSDFFIPNRILQQKFLWEHGSLDKILPYLGKILANIFLRSWQDLAKILLRYPWRVDPGRYEADLGRSRLVTSYLLFDFLYRLSQHHHATPIVQES